MCKLPLKAPVQNISKFRCKNCVICFMLYRLSKEIKLNKMTGNIPNIGLIWNR